MANSVAETDTSEAGAPRFLQSLQDVIAVKDWSVQFEAIVSGKKMCPSSIYHVVTVMLFIIIGLAVDLDTLNERTLKS